jgi:hypothetical protein
MNLHRTPTHRDLLRAVSNGSIQPPKFIVLTYPRARRQRDERLAVDLLRHHRLHARLADVHLQAHVELPRKLAATGEELAFEAPLPEDMQALLAALADDAAEHGQADG